MRYSTSSLSVYLTPKSSTTNVKAIDRTRDMTKQARSVGTGYEAGRGQVRDQTLLSEQAGLRESIHALRDLKQNSTIVDVG